MSNNLPMMNGKGEQKSMWQKPGGTLGMIVAGLGVAAGAMVLYKILPALIVLAQNTLVFAGLLAAIAAIIYVITDKKFRTLFSASYFMLMRWLTGLVVEINPIAIVEQRIEQMRKKIAEIKKIMGDLLGYINKADSDLAKDKKEFDDLIRMVKYLKSHNKNDDAIVKERQVTRMEADIKDQMKAIQDSRRWYETLCKLEKMAELTVEDTENEVNMRKKTFERIRKQHKAFKSVMSIMNGDPDEMALFTQAMDYMADDISTKLGEMEHVINSTGGLLSEFEAGNGIAADKATDLIAKYDKMGIEGIFATFESAPSGNKLALESKEINRVPIMNIGKTYEANAIEVSDSPQEKRTYF
jgi:hypothetical protein